MACKEVRKGGKREEEELTNSVGWERDRSPCVKLKRIKDILKWIFYYIM